MAIGDVAVSITKPDARQCAKFDGVDDKITGNLATTFENQCTISIWIKPEDLSLNEQFIAASVSTWTAGWSLRKTNRFIFDIIVNGTRHTITDTTGFTRTWMNITGVYDGTNVILYRDGVNVGSENASGNITNSTSTLKLGVLSTTLWFKGCMQNLKIWNRALSEAEVTKLYAGIHITDGLVGYWPLKSDYLDYSGNGNNGTNSGSVLVTSDGPVAKAVADARVNASDTIFAVDVENGTRVLTGQITQA